MSNINGKMPYLSDAFKLEIAVRFLRCLMTRTPAPLSKKTKMRVRTQVKQCAKWIGLPRLERLAFVDYIIGEMEYDDKRLLPNRAPVKQKPRSAPWLKIKTRRGQKCRRPNSVMPSNIRNN